MKPARCCCYAQELLQTRCWVACVPVLLLLLSGLRVR